MHVEPPTKPSSTPPPLPPLEVVPEGRPIPRGVDACDNPGDAVVESGISTIGSPGSAAGGSTGVPRARCETYSCAKHCALNNSPTTKMQHAHSQNVFWQRCCKHQTHADTLRYRSHHSCDQASSSLMNVKRAARARQHQSVQSSQADSIRKAQPCSFLFLCLL